MAGENPSAKAMRENDKKNAKKASGNDKYAKGGKGKKAAKAKGKMKKKKA